MSTPNELAPGRTVTVTDGQLRVTEGDARTALNAVLGQPVVAARARLRFGPGRTCESLARMLDRAIRQAETVGADPRSLVVADASVEASEDIIRVRRTGYGAADWIHSPTCRVQITLRPPGWRDPQPPVQPRRPRESRSSRAGGAATRGPQAAAVRQALAEVIDPDLGVNIVDLGFVRAIVVANGRAAITMTLTSAACPLVDNMTNQIDDALSTLDEVTGFDIDWQWVPAWRPSDVSECGREQLRAIGFTV